MFMLGRTTSRIPTIILGMNAVHGSPRESDMLSIAALDRSTLQGSPDNVLHDTVIDNKVCHPKNNDFYLGTHAGMIGITRQTHYHVLLDQAGFSANDLWGQFMKIRDASETSSSHGGMYVPGEIPVPQLSRLKDKVNNFIIVC
ncbi:hypothetical protein GOBAR_AA11730 [Gossypium barbadense]|uniref:Piwi domain-containing protein n=1 Tax=Gossypium barbadense TaxID=3634 RepID=A0A2P5Y004_GOSBA|nr:hypothetical protein GOBAR_AA11730 [Gossypium barbadense]